MGRKPERPNTQTPSERARTDPAYRRLQDDRRKAFGAQLRQLREEDGLDQADVAERSGLHRSYIGQVERGEANVTIDNMWALADAFDVTPGEMFLEAE